MGRKLDLATKCLHSGHVPKNGEPRVFPMVQSTTYRYDKADTLGDLFDLKISGYFYSRVANPTVAHLEEKIADLEGGVAAVATTCGQSANALAVLTLCKVGDHIVALSNIYGGTISLMANTLKRFGIETTFISPDSTDEEIQKSIKANTKLIFGETIGNPRVEVLDIERVANLAHKNNIPLVIDNTLATPILCRPIEHGADIVVHSTTKYIDGHARALGGIVVDSGKFNWSNGKFEEFTEPDESYHGLSYYETFKELSYAVKARVTLIRDLGFVQTAFNAFNTDQGIETLALRMERHSQNALEIAKYLEKHSKVEWVNYPKLESNKTYDLANKYLSGGSGIISFGIKGNVDSAKKFIDSLELIPLQTHIADSKSCVIHPASTTHRQLSKEQMEASGITENLIRFSVGIESVKDLLADVEKALEKI